MAAEENGEARHKTNENHVSVHFSKSSRRGDKTRRPIPSFARRFFPRRVPLVGKTEEISIAKKKKKKKRKKNERRRKENERKRKRTERVSLCRFVSPVKIADLFVRLFLSALRFPSFLRNSSDRRNVIRTV